MQSELLKETLGKIYRPAQRREIVERAVRRRGVSIALACRTFSVRETCYRYGPKLRAEKERIGDLLIGLTNAHKIWGFDLCFLHLRNVKGYGWNHKRVYRTFRDLGLNLRIKPRKRLVRKKPDELAVPETPNKSWSMKFASRTYGLWHIGSAMGGASGF